MKLPLLMAALAFAGLKLGAQQAGTVTFGNDGSCVVSNGQAGRLVTAADGIQAALYWAPLASSNFVQIGAAVNVGVPLDGLFAGGTRMATNPATSAFTPGGSNAQF